VIVRTRPRRRKLELCANGCARQRDHATRTATHVAVVIDYEIPLCSSCAKAWPAMWEEALQSSAAHREAVLA
jgi:hypothetical protein